MLTHLSLFSGIGGIDLAAEWAGFTTVGQCEMADYPTKILEKHWPDVPRWRDIHELTGADFRARTGLRTVDLISGGFPCQPFSVAGKQAGKEDERYLFPEMLRVIAELKPHFVLGENVPGILRIAAADVVASLESEGYNVVVFDFEAAATGAHHRRERVFFVAEYAYSDKRHTLEVGKLSKKQTHDSSRICEKVVSDAKSTGLQRLDRIDIPQQGASPRQGFVTAAVTQSGKNFWGGGVTEPELVRMVHGIPDRVDRIKALGNAVVPQQVYPILKAIAEEALYAQS